MVYVISRGPSNALRSELVKRMNVSMGGIVFENRIGNNIKFA